MNILLALLFVLVGCENDVKPLWLSGSWKGTFKDTYTSTDPKTHFVDQPAYPAELFYKVSTNSGTVTYPTLGCTSNWVFVKTDNDTLFFDEKITSDKNNVGCVDKMHYKLLQLSKNQIAIIGTGKTANGHSIGTNGVLAKVDYSKNASANVSSQKDETPQKTNNEYSEKLNINKSEQTVLNSVPNPQLRNNTTRNAAPNTNSIIGSWLMKTVLKSNPRKVNIWKIVYQGDNSFVIYKNSEFAFSGNYKFSNNKLSDIDVNGNISKTYDVKWINDNQFSYMDGKNKYYYVRENNVTNSGSIKGSIIYSDNGDIITISEGGYEPPVPEPAPGLCSACWGTCKENCSICLGDGRIKYKVTREKYNAGTDRYETYYEDAYQDCTAGCNNGQVPCPYCKCK